MPDAPRLDTLAEEDDKRRGSTATATTKGPGNDSELGGEADATRVRPRAGTGIKLNECLSSSPLVCSFVNDIVKFAILYCKNNAQNQVSSTNPPDRPY